MLKYKLKESAWHFRREGEEEKQIYNQQDRKQEAGRRFRLHAEA